MMNDIKKKVVSFLLWIQKWTKTDMLYLVKGGFWLLAGQVVYIGINVVSTIAFANLLPEETYGTYKYAMSIIALLSIPTLGGINLSLTRAVAKNCEGDLIPAIKTKIKWGIIGGLASISLGLYYLFKGNVTLGTIFLLTSIFIPFLETLNIYAAYLNGLKKFKIYSAFSQSTQIINISLSIITIFFTKNIFLIILVYLISNTLARLFFTILTIKRYPPNKETDKETIPLGKHLSLVNIIGIIADNIDKVLIFTFLGAPEVAIYSMAIKPVKEIQSIFKNINTLALPKFSQRSWEEIKSSVPEKMNKLFIILIPVTLAWILIAPFIFKFLFPRYISAIPYSQVYAITILLFPRTIIAQSLIAQAAKKHIYIINVITPLSQIIFMLILLPFFKIWGAIFACLASYLICYLYLRIIFQKKSN